MASVLTRALQIARGQWTPVNFELAVLAYAIFGGSQHNRANGTTEFFPALMRSEEFFALCYRWPPLNGAFRFRERTTVTAEIDFSKKSRVRKVVKSNVFELT